MDADAAHAALIALHGIGPWTADIYLLFCLGHADAWPAGDLAVQEAARIAFGLRKRPDAEGAHQARRSLAAVARRGGASVVGLLSRGEAARGHLAESNRPKRQDEESRKEEGKRTNEERLSSTDRASSRARARRKQLVVFLHGYGADGNDLIDIGRAWQACCPTPRSCRRTRRARAGRRRRAANGFR